MELLYQYLWKQRMMGRKCVTVRGEDVEIEYAGIHNMDAGPDFHDARIRIAGQLWAGNVEIHVRAGDWYRHGHDSDPAYENVILHVVAVDDARIKRADGSEIPQMVVTFPESFFRMYEALSLRIKDVACEPYLSLVPELTRADWLSTLAVERLQIKARRIMDCATSLGGDWNRTCFVSLARALGFNLNGEPFEMLARSLPLNVIHHHSDDILQIEALMFGQAGMLDTSLHIFDEYYQTLAREYFFLARKYGLKPMNASMWKYARTRPQNFPHRRIAMLSAAMTDGFTLLADLWDRRKRPDDIRKLFNLKPSPYWDTHSDFDIAGNASGQLSPAAIDLLMINFTAPMIYAYSASRGDYEAAEAAMSIWDDLKPENNTFIRQWTAAGIRPQCAADSQALLQLRKQYCDYSRCLECRFAAAILKASAGSHFYCPAPAAPEF